MASNNIWIESPVVPAHAKNLEMFDGGTPADKMHITLDFSKLKADQLGWPEVVALRDELVEAARTTPAPSAVHVNGAAILQPGAGDIAVVLVNGGDLWEYRQTVHEVFTQKYMQDDTYPGWLPHITVGEGVSNHYDLSSFRTRTAEIQTISLERPLLRVGRLALPL